MNNSQKFEKFNFLLDEAEGKQFYPQDPSMFGVTKESYEDYLKKKLTKKVEEITYDEAKQVRSAIWDRAKCEKINSDNVSVLFGDHVYNVGLSRANKHLQEVLNETFKAGLKVDGKVGNLTMGAINANLPKYDKEMYEALWWRRVKYYQTECKVDVCPSLVDSRLNRVFAKMGFPIPIPTAKPIVVETPAEPQKNVISKFKAFFSSKIGTIVLASITLVGVFFIFKAFRGK